MRFKWVAPALLLLPSLALGQSLGEAAAKERERRKKAQESGQAPSPVITEKELNANRGQLANDPDAAPAAAASSRSQSRGSRGAVPDSLDARAAQEEKWRSTAAQLRARADRARKEYEYWSSQHLAGGEYFVDENGKKLVGSAESLQGLVANKKAALEVAEKALADFEELARRENIPPGWLR
jgi:hypothetical protein